jgi:hypothetical protein
MGQRNKKYFDNLKYERIDNLKELLFIIFHASIN